MNANKKDYMRTAKKLATDTTELQQFAAKALEIDGAREATMELKP